MQPSASVYGPVDSWRYGRSLGIDLICQESVCSFRCVYCQLGRIVHHTGARQRFVPTEVLERDLRGSDWRSAEVASFSGSGEPTLALNLGEGIDAVKRITGLYTLVLTNGTLLGDPAVREELGRADEVSVKLDAADETTFRRVNRPVAGVELEELLAKTRLFREGYGGKFTVQVMLLPWTLSQAEAIAARLAELAPDEVHLNTPTRPFPVRWHIAARGAHGPDRPYEARQQAALTGADLAEAARHLSRATGLEIQVRARG